LCTSEDGTITIRAIHCGDWLFTYYFGAGWNQWGFANDQVWFDYLRDFSLKLQQPLKVVVQ
jgi:hypothetical protein